MNWLLLGAVWALLLLGSYLFLAWRPARFVSPPKYAWLIVVTVALLVRLVPNFVLPAGAAYDVESFEIVGGHFLNGEEVYSSTAGQNRHPYLPLQMYWMAFSLKVADRLGVPFVKMVRLAPILADVAIAFVLSGGWRRLRSGKASFQMGMLYALNPVAVFVSAYHGQFDSFAALLMLLAVAQVTYAPLKAGGWLGLAILDKSWPVLALPNVLAGGRGWRKKGGILGLAVGIPLAGVLIYARFFQAEPWLILKQAVSYNWGVGVWGYTYFVRMLLMRLPGFPVTFYRFAFYARFLTLGMLGLVWWFGARKMSPFAGVLTVLVGFLAVTHAFSIQYLVWVLPLGLLAQDFQWVHRFTLAAFAYMFLAYHTLILGMYVTALMPWPEADLWIIIPSGLPAWLVVVGWLRARLGVHEPEPAI